MSEITIKEIEISPLMAIEMLTKNNINRPLRQKTVSFYSKQMLDGDWSLTPEGISFDENGNLLNGQHRLSAIVLSKKTIKFMVFENVPSNTFSKFDTGKLRNGADNLAILGVKNATTVTGGITKYLFLKDNKQSSPKARDGKITNINILRFYEKHDLLIDEITKESKKIYSKRRVFRGSEIVGYVLYYKLNYNIEHERILLFFENATGIFKNGDSGNVAKLLSDKLLKYQFENRPLNGSARTKFILYCLDLYLTGKVVKRLNYKEL